jgi:hypothetical protein
MQFFKTYNPFDLNLLRTRELDYVYLSPAFGLLGIDFGHGLMLYQG